MNKDQQLQLLTSQKTVEYYTPENHIQLVKEFYDGSIDLDPASCKLAQSWIQAKSWFGPEQENENLRDGLALSWVENKIFVNPPYCNRAAIWCEKAEQEFREYNNEIILLIFSKLGYKWYEKLFAKYTTCLVTERIKFVNEQGIQTGQAKHASSYVYMGRTRSYEFKQVFERIGRIIKPDV